MLILQPAPDPRSRARVTSRSAVPGAKIAEIDVVADPERLRGLDRAVLSLP
jgi:hypothetical protein